MFVAHKRIQGGVQADISLRVTSNFPWQRSCLTLHPYGCSETLLPFRVENKHRSKKWSDNASKFSIQQWTHKRYTSVRVQFCKRYYDQRLQFTFQVEGERAVSATPIIVVKNAPKKHAGNCRKRKYHELFMSERQDPELCLVARASEQLPAPAKAYCTQTFTRNTMILPCIELANKMGTSARNGNACNRISSDFQPLSNCLPWGPTTFIPQDDVIFTELDLENIKDRVIW